MDISLSKISQLTELYIEIQEEFSEFQNKSGLNCISGCGACCLGSDITATVFEMLPLAQNLLERGDADKYLNMLVGMEELPCVLYFKNSSDGKQGFCSEYQLRPTICRVFAASGRLGKNGEVQLSLCRLIKEQIGQSFPLLLSTLSPPLMSEWKQKVKNLEEEMYSGKEMPINLALKIALEKILFFNHLKTQSQLSPTQLDFAIGL